MPAPERPRPGLHLITGRAGAGKTRLLTEALAAHMRRGERAILIVPEQHTFEAERRVAEAAGGLFGVQVLSLERLSERVLHTAGERRTFLTEQGVRMVVRRAALHRQQSLRAFSHVARANGFAGEIAALIASRRASRPRCCTARPPRCRRIRSCLKNLPTRRCCMRTWRRTCPNAI